MNIENAHHARDIVLTCYICDDQYTGDRIEKHLGEWEYDWNVEEVDKPQHERIPLPKPPSDFLKLFEAAKKLLSMPEQAPGNHSDEDDQEGEGEENESEEVEDEEEEEESEPEDKQPLSTYDRANERQIQTENDPKPEKSLIPCPNCSRTFFPDRLNMHLKSCKPDKPMKKAVGKKPAYQPPKLKTKSSWKPPKEEESSERSTDRGEIEERKVKQKPKQNKPKEKPDIGRRTNYNSYDDPSLVDDPKEEYNTTSKSTKHINSAKKSQTSMKMNTVTTFSRMDEEAPSQFSGHDDMFAPPANDNRVEWANWGRKFNPDRLPVHQKSCNNMKKRSVFNSQKKRAADELQTMGTLKKKSKVTKSETKKKPNMSEKKAKWKREHEDLVKAIKMSRLIKKVQESGGDITKIPVAPSAPNEDYVECQYCYRRYSPGVADRHIPKCKDMINRPKPPPHILRRLKEEEAQKKKRREKWMANRTHYNQDPKNLTTNNFGKDLNTENSKEAFNTQYPFKPPLRKIMEENEDEPYKNRMKRKVPTGMEVNTKRGKSMNPNAVKSNGFSRSAINNSTSYQTNFNDAAISTSTSKNFMNSPLTTIDNKKNIKRSESLIARSSGYSTVPCPHWDRTFSSAAAERHVPICKSLMSKPPTLNSSNRKRSSVQLPHLSKTNYNNGGFESNLMNNTSSTFRTSASKLPNDTLSKTSQQAGLPPTHKGTGSKTIVRTRKDFATKRWYCGSCGHRYGNVDKFCSMCGDKRII